jgi:gamma-glutamyl phosphate reductase
MKRSLVAILLGIFLILGVFLLMPYNPSFPGPVSGIDRNHDGVRDDLEKLIEEKYGQDRKLRSIARELAKSYQMEIEHPDEYDSAHPLAIVTCLSLVAHESMSDLVNTIQSAAVKHDTSHKSSCSL